MVVLSFALVTDSVTVLFIISHEKLIVEKYLGTSGYTFMFLVFVEKFK